MKKILYTIIFVLISTLISYAGTFQKNDDKRCSFFYNISKPRPVGGSFLDTEGLRKLAKATKKGWNFNPQHIEMWYRYLFNSTPFQMKPVSAPPYLWGRFYPMTDDIKTQENLFGKESKNVMRFTTVNTFQMFVKFPNQTKVPCGWLAVYFKKWKVEMMHYQGRETDPVFVIYDPKFVPKKQ